MNEQHLLREIKDMFEHYDTYLTKAQELSKTLPQAEGDKNAARIICRIASKLT